MIEYVALQAGRDSLAVTTMMVSEGAMDYAPPNYLDWIHHRLDRQLLDACGYVDRRRQRLKYTYPYWSRPDFPTWVPDSIESRVLLLDGPVAGDYYSVPPSRSLFIPVVGGPQWEYEIHRFRDRRFGLFRLETYR